MRPLGDHGLEVQSPPAATPSPGRRREAGAGGAGRTSVVADVRGRRRRLGESRSSRSEISGWSCASQIASVTATVSA